MQNETPKQSRGLGRYIAYLVMLSLGVGGFLAIRHFGVDLKVISPTLFAMLVLMAVIATVSTTPILRAIGKLKPALPPPAPTPASSPS